MYAYKYMTARLRLYVIDHRSSTYILRRKRNRCRMRGSPSTSTSAPRAYIYSTRDSAKFPYGPMPNNTGARTAHIIVALISAVIASSGRAVISFGSAIAVNPLEAIDER